MSRSNDLPFARGETAYGGDTALIAAADATAYTGLVKTVTDPDTGEEIELIALRNSTGGVVYPGFGYKPAATYLDKRVDGYPTASGFGYVCDPYYRTVGTTSIASGDVAWFINKGRCNGGKTGANWTDGNALAFVANGVMSPISATTAGMYVIARANETKVHASAATSGEYALCYVGTAHGFYNSEAPVQTNL
jgi:hypothetical protein